MQWNAHKHRPQIYTVYDVPKIIRTQGVTFGSGKLQTTPAHAADHYTTHNAALFELSGEIGRPEDSLLWL